MRNANMRCIATRRIVMAATLAAASGTAIPIHAQDTGHSTIPGGSAEQTASAPTLASSAVESAQPQAPNQPAQATSSSKPVKFNFKDAPVDQVLDFVARETGLPIIYEATSPKETITFVGSSSYTIDDAISILNLNLRRMGVHLRRQEQFLYLASLENSAKKPIPVATKDFDSSVTPDQIITVPIPLDNAAAAAVAEQIKPLIGPYGGVVAVPAQNMVIVVEFADQIRRIRDIIGAIDSVRPADSAYKVFPIKFAPAEAVLNSLKGLMSEKSTTIVVDKDGKKVTLQDQQVQGLNLTADNRTNSIIGVGPVARLRTAEELIAILDVPEASKGEGRMLTFTLAATTADSAAAKLNAMFNGMWAEIPRDPKNPGAADPRRKPVVIPSPETGRVTVVGDVTALNQASALMAEIDPGAVGGDNANPQGARETRALMISLKHVTPQSVESIVTRLLSPRQVQMVKFAPAPDGRSMVVAGPAAEVAEFEKLVKGLDVASQSDKDVRMVRIATGDPAAILRRAEALYASTNQQERDPISISLDKDTRMVTLIGSPRALASFEKVLSVTQATTVVDLEVRRFELSKSQPTLIAPKLLRLARPMLTPNDGGTYQEPQVEAIDDLRLLIVRAHPSQFAVLDTLIKQLDIPGERAVRTIPVSGDTASTVREKALAMYQTQLSQQPGWNAIDVTADDRSGTLLVVADNESMRRFTTIVEELQRRSGPAREIRMIELKKAKAEDIAASLQSLAAATGSLLALGGPQPVFEPVPGLNSILVAAQPGQLAVAEQLVRVMDERGGKDTELRTYKITRSDPSAIAATIRNLASAGTLTPEQGKAGAGLVTVDAEVTSRTLVVSAPVDSFAHIEKLLKDLDAERPATTLRIYPLKNARSERLQPLLQKLLLTRLREDKRLTGVGDTQTLLDVTADNGTNSLLINAPEGVQAIAQELINTLDNDSTSAGKAVVKVVPLLFADAPVAGTALSQTIASMEFPSGTRPVVVPAPGSNALIITGAQTDLAKIEEIVKSLDVRPTSAETPGIETFALKHADANSIAKTVENLLVDQQATDPKLLQLQMQFARQNRQDLFRKPTIRVEASGRTNSLIISAPAATLELAKTIVERLDQPADKTGRTARTFTPAKANAAQLAATVSRIAGATLPQGRGPVEITPEPGSGAIIVIGTQEQVTETIKLLADFDSRATALPAVELQSFDVRFADATAVAGTLQAFLSERSRWPAELVQAEKSGLPVAQPTARADAKANRIMLSAPSLLMPVARDLLLAMDKPSEKGVVDVQVFRLRKGDATPVAAAVKAALSAAVKPGEPIPSVTAEPASNSVIISGSADALIKAKELINGMDDAAKPDGLGVRTIFLRFARAEAVAPVVENVFSRGTILEQLPFWYRAEYLRSTGKGDQPEVKVTAEKRLNALIVSGPAAVLDTAEQIVSELDKDQVPGSTEAHRAVRIIPLNNADAAQLAANLTAIFAEEAGQEQPATIRVDAPSNSLIVRGSERQLSTVEALAGKLDAASVGASKQMKMISVDRSRADADILARTLKRLIEQQGNVKVEVISTEELLKRQREGSSRGEETPQPRKSGLRWNLDPVPERPDRGVQSHEHLIASDSWRAQFGFVLLSAVFAAVDTEASVPARQATDEQPDSKPQGQEQPGVTIAVDPATNTLMILGSPRMTERLAALAAELEKELPPEPTLVRIITLPPSVDPQSVAEAARQAIQQIGRRNANNPTGFTSTAAVLPDPAGNAVIIIANETDFATLSPLVASVADPGTALRVTVKVYPLSSITAQRASNAIRDVLSADPQGRQARRVRSMEVTVAGGAATRIDPALVRVTPSPTGSAVIVSAPSEAFTLIDRLIETIDQSSVKERPAIRRYELRNARASDLSRTLQRLFDAQLEGSGLDWWEMASARFVADDRTNTLLVTATTTQHAEVERLLSVVDASGEDKELKLAMIPLKQASPQSVQRIVDEVVIGKDQGRRDKIRVSSQEGSSLLIVRARQEDIDEIKAIVAQVDTAEATGLPMRSIKLKQADAASVAGALTRFFTDRARASSRPGQRVENRVSIIGDRRSSTILVAASDEDFATVESLVQTFDTPADMQEAQFKVIPLKNAKVSDIEQTITRISGELQWERYNTIRWGPQTDQRPSDRMIVEVNERSNSVVIFGSADLIATMEKVVAALDQPASDRTALAIRAVAVKNADLAALKSVIEKSMKKERPEWWYWDEPDPDAVTVEIDKRGRALLLVGKPDRVDKAVAAIEQIDEAFARGGQQVETIPLRHAKADQAAQSLRQFFTERARGQGVEAPAMFITGSTGGNLLLVSGDAENMKVLKDLVAQIDQPDFGKDRKIEVYVLKNGEARDMAETLRSMFPRTGRAEEQLLITPMPSTNSLVVSAPEAIFPQVEAMLRQIDAPPSAETANIVTIGLTTARAQDVASALTRALPPNVKVTITPVQRTNSILLTGGKEAIAIAMDQIKKIDTEPVRSLIEFRRFKLQHADAMDISWTITSMFIGRRGTDAPSPNIDYSRADNTLMVSATADQIGEIERMLTELDKPTVKNRKTEFIKLQFAKAEQTRSALTYFYGRSASEATTPGARAVTIIADPASNSLVISADPLEWEGIRALLSKLDSKEYDTSRQLAVIPLVHADASSVARTLNEGFRTPLEDQARQDRARAAANQQRRPAGQPGRNDEGPEPTLLVSAEGAPVVSAEQLTNSLVVFAGPRDLERIQEVVKQLDVSGFAAMPEARIIALKSGKPSAVAATIRELFLNKLDGRGAGTAAPGGPRSVLVIGDDNAGALIVRASDEQFAQIKTLSQTLQQQGELGRITPHVVRLKSVAAGRLRTTLLSTFTETAKQQGETLAIEVDRSSNALVIACSPRLLEQMRPVIDELDRRVGDGENSGVPVGLNQSVFIIDVKNSTPEAVRKQLDDMGLTRPQPVDRPGVVSEPITIVPMATRNAVAIVAAPGDGDVVTALVRVLDAEPAEAGQQIAVIPLKKAGAKPLADTLTSMLRPIDPANQIGPAKSLAEHVRRLSLLRTGVDQSGMEVDLSRPVRVIPDTETNSVILASTPGNIAALREIVKQLDTLPIGDAVVVRIFNLDNASSSRVQQVVERLFRDGEALRRLPGTQRRGLPSTATGQALAGEIAVAIDERTNALIVAGREEAVALVEVLVKDLDSEKASNWIEPAIIRLSHADAATLAKKLNDVLVKGFTTTPEAAGLQKQYGRLRVLREGRNPADAASRAEADLFSPITSLVITPEEELNAIIVVGTTSNIAVVEELVKLLDVEAASASNTVRVFPLRHAASDRIANLVRDVLRQRESLPDQRPEDKVVITSDVRTNSLVVSTSPKSFAIVEGLLKTLDTEHANFSVGLRVLPVLGADVRTLAPKIERLMKERIQAAAQSGSVRNPLDAFSIEPEPTSNLLIVASSDENFQVVRELLTALTSDAGRIAGGERVDVVQLKGTRASDAAQSIDTLYVRRENERRGAGSVSVIPNERLNALVVSGTEKDVIEIRAMAGRLDGAEVTAVRQVKPIELKSANAAEVVQLIRNVLAGTPVGGGRVASQQATRVQFIRKTLEDQAIGTTGSSPRQADLDSAIRDQVTLTPDIRTNTVWITAPAPIVDLISEMVEEQERTSAGSRRIEYFQLVNADARQMAVVLRDTFNLRQQGNTLVLVPGRAPTSADSPSGPEIQPDGLSGTTLTAVPDERQALSIAIDFRTNTLIVSGTEEYLSLVRDLITQLDAIEATEREQQVVHLKNARAKLIETTLQNYFKGESDKERLTLGPNLTGSLMRQLEQEVTVVGDEKSNKLVISTSPRYMETVLKIVKELDAAPPQVMIEVLLAEVTLDTARSWGMDANLGPFGKDIYRFGYTAAGAGVTSAIGVPNFAISSADFGLLIRSLESQGKLEVLSNPQVTANDNEEANITVGEDIPLVTGVQTFTQGNSNATVERENVGITLKVTPSISNDGFVQMKISPGISTLTSRTVQVSRDVAAPIISKRTVDTLVTVKDGQSVVIGGLIQTNEEQRRSKVPILGDIPILGIPFRTYQSTTIKTELLVIVTPRVIPGHSEAGASRAKQLTEEQIDKMEDPSKMQDYIEQIRLRESGRAYLGDRKGPPAPDSEE